MQKNTLNLLQNHGIVFSQHYCCANEQDYEKFDNKLTALLNSWEMDNAMYSVCDLKSKNFLYISPMLQNLFGQQKPADWSPGNKNGFYGTIYPDDLAFVLDTEIMVYEFLQTLPLHERLNYRLIYEFRLLGAENNLYRIINQLKIFEYDKFGNSWLLLVKSNLMPGMLHCETLRRSMINRQTKELCLFLDENGNKPQQLLTKREQEILALIAQGLDNTYISEKLFISTCTLSKHKQNIIEKTQTANIIQALSYATILGLI